MKQTVVSVCSQFPAWGVLCKPPPFWPSACVCVRQQGDTPDPSPAPRQTAAPTALAAAENRCQGCYATATNASLDQPGGPSRTLAVGQGTAPSKPRWSQRPLRATPGAMRDTSRHIQPRAFRNPGRSTEESARTQGSAASPPSFPGAGFLGAFPPPPGLQGASASPPAGAESRLSGNFPPPPWVSPPLFTRISGQQGSPFSIIPVVK